MNGSLKSNQPHFLTLLLLLAIALHAEAQSVGINNNGSIPDSSAILDVRSNNKGLLIPRMTTIERSAIAAPANGLLVFDETTNSFWFYSGGWNEIQTGSGADSDWYLQGSTDPADIDEDVYRIGRVAIGHDSPSFPLDIHGAHTRMLNISSTVAPDSGTSAYGTHISMSGNGAGDKLGSFKELVSSGTGDQTGTRNVLGGNGDGNHVGNINIFNNSGNGLHYGTANNHIGDGGGDHVGIYNYLSGMGNGDQFGTFNFIDNGGDARKFGVYNILEATGGTRHTGTYTALRGTASGFQIGNEIRITNSDPSNNHFGSSIILNSDGNGLRVGGERKISGAGDGTHYGLVTDLTGSGNGWHYGMYNLLEGDGTGNQYGIFNDLDVSGNANHTGVWTRLNGPGNGIKRAYAARLFGNGNGMQYGMDINITNAGTGDHYGADIRLSGEGDGVRYGVYTEISGGGDGAKYGSYNYIPHLGSGTHIAGYFDADGGSNDYAGYFDRGNVVINHRELGFYLRVKGNTTPDAFVVNGGQNNNVGIGVFDAACDLEIVGPDNTDAIQFDNGNVRLRHHYDVISSDRDFFHILIDANNDQDNSVFRIYKNVSEGLISDPTIQFALDGQGSWIDVPGLGVGRIVPSHPLHMGSGAHVTAGGVWTNASDRSKKKEISDIKYGLGEVLQLMPRSYRYKADEAESIGFIAQEIEEIMPEVVSGEEGDKGVAYGLLTAVLVRAIQEQQSEIEELKEILAKQTKLFEAVLKQSNSPGSKSTANK